MPDEFDDALDRMDVTFEDFASDESILDSLDAILGRPASMLQFDLITQRIQRERQQAVNAGVTVDRFRRGGREVTQLRDRAGRFVTQGAANIRDFLSRQ